MKILIDCMGGDKAPGEMLAGTVAAHKEFGGTYILFGHREEIQAAATQRGLDLSPFEIVHAESVVNMKDDPMSCVRGKTDSSMAMALHALKEGRGDVMVSCGNTGALFSGATLIVRRMAGVHRAAIGTILPFERPTLLLDAGANVTVQTDYLVQFATMGTAYMKALYGIESPRVALLNNGAEECKGTSLQQEAYRMLSQCPGIHFAGNVESCDLPFGACDVVVTDGYSGNICIKAYEGLGKYMLKGMKQVFYATPLTRLGALCVRRRLADFKRSVDTTEHGGSPFLGLNMPVIKAHGSSGAKAFKSAIRQAIRLCESQVLDELRTAMTQAAPQGAPPHNMSCETEKAGDTP